MSQPKKIEFTGGFTIVPNGTTPPGPGDYYLVDDYRSAGNNGEIIIPLHDTNPGIASLDFNDVDQNNGNAIYINGNDSNGNDNTTYLMDLIGNHTHLTFRQNTYHVTFDCTNQAWQYGGGYPNQFYHDPTFEGAPQNSISIVSTSGQTFNDVDPITITIQVI
jgi:hypothetical protein